VGAGPQLGFIIPLTSETQGYLNPQKLLGIRQPEPARRVEWLGHIRDLAGGIDGERGAETNNYQIVPSPAGVNCATPVIIRRKCPVRSHPALAVMSGLTPSLLESEHGSDDLWNVRHEQPVRHPLLEVFEARESSNGHADRQGAIRRSQIQRHTWGQRSFLLRIFS